MGKAKKGKKTTADDSDFDDTSAAMEVINDTKKNKKKKGKDDELDNLVKEIQNVEVEPKKTKKKKKKEVEFDSDDDSAKVNVENDEMKETKSKKKKEVKETKKPTKDDDDESKAESKDNKKKKKAVKEEKVEKDDGKKGPGKRAIAAMQETLKKIKEEEERLQREEQERIRLEEEAEQERLELARKEQEKKEKKKQREKERKERLKAEGKLLTAKQKADKARALAMLEALKAQGVELPEIGEKRPRPGTRDRRLKKDKSADDSSKTEATQVKETEPVEVVEKVESEDDVKDAWDETSEEEDDDEEAIVDVNKIKGLERDVKVQVKKRTVNESESDSGDESSDDDDSEDETNRQKELAKRKERALLRIQKRREDAEKKRTLDDLRAAVVCVLGHVDTGKTKILDKLRRTNVQDGEAGGITQQIGATNVPIDNIKEQAKHVKGFSEKQLKLPGLLIIDTPGHESFSNLRNRGSSLCDIAILVVDIMHGLEPQTIESINLLKEKRTPFVVALNKIDRLYDWQTMARKDIRDVLKAQEQHTQNEFDTRTKQVIIEFAEQGLNAALFYENPDPNEYVSLVPTSAISGEGMGNILALLIDMCQGHLAERLMYSEELQATVLEVKQIPGLGTTIDCILVNGLLREGDTMIVAGTDGPIVTQIRSLLMPQPMKELRVKNAYIEYKEIKAAQGVKIAAKELEKTIAGLNLLVARAPEEVDILKEEISRELKSALSSIKLAERGVFVQASTLGSLEALLEFLQSSKIPYSGIRIGPVVKKDVMKASIMLEHDNQYATILAFDVKVERDAQELADSLGVKIFQADIIYHLFDKFIKYREDIKARKREEFKSVAVFPCKLKVLPQFVFNSRDPIVCGVMVEAGVVREGTPICVPTKEFVELGIVTSIENNHKAVETARKGQEVCIKIEPIPGESPKMFGRHFDETDMLVSKISRQSIDACKDYFRDDLLKSDWQLMVELKKTFQIL